MEKYTLATYEKLEEKLSTFPYSRFYKYNLSKEYESFLKFIRCKRMCSFSDDKIIINKKEFDVAIREFLDTKFTTMNKYMTRTNLKNIFKVQNIPFNKSDYPANNYTEFKDVDDKIVTYGEFELEINSLFNESEKLLSYMAFRDLLGEELVNARFAKVEDVNFEEGIWKLYDGKEVKLDNELLITLLKNTINQKKYLPYDKKEKKTDAGTQFPSSYPYNMDSPYLIKTRIHTRTNDGLSPFSKVGIEAIFKRLIIEFGDIWYKSNLKTSGFLDLMYKENPSPNWTIAKIENFKKEVGIKISPINTKIFFLQKYFPENLIESKE